MTNRKRAATPRQQEQSLTLSIRSEVAFGRPSAAFLRTQLRRAHELLSPALQDLSVALVSDRRMSELHERFMGIAGPTDVLTFELDRDARGRVTAGEIVICVPEAGRQARDRGIELRMELLLYAIHGMLHLCGFDDRTDRGFRTMHRLEDDILTRLGFQPVFAPQAATRRPASHKRRRTGARTR